MREPRRGVLLWGLVGVGLRLGNVAHVERGEGGWLWDCTVELVLAVLDDGFEAFEDLEVVFAGREAWLVKLLLGGDVVRVGHGEGRGGEGGGEEGRGVL